MVDSIFSTQTIFSTKIQELKVLSHSIILFRLTYPGFMNVLKVESLWYSMKSKSN